MNSIKKLALAAIAVSISGCAAVPSDAGYSYFINTSTSSELATTAATTTKVGRACAENVLGLFITGDSSIEAAKKEGNITKVASVDKEISQYVVYAKVCTVVRGN